MVLVSHEWVGPRRAFAAYLAHARPELRIQPVEPGAVVEALADDPSSVVLCDHPTPEVQTGARGWIALPLDGRSGASSGTGSAVRSMAGTDLEDILAVIDELIGGTWAAPLG